MTIQQHIHECLNHTTMLRQLNPAIVNVRYELFDFPYEELREFATHSKKELRMDTEKSKAFLIVSPFNGNGELDSDIWFYSAPVKIRPAEIVPID